MKLKDKVAIVTGASRGLGRAIAIALAREDADVVVNYLDNEQAALEVVNKIKKMGRRTFHIRADVRNFEEIQMMVKRTMNEFGQIDILVNNAGIVKDRTVANMTKEEWDDVIATDLTGIFNCTKAVLDVMIKRGFGKIVNISSVVGQMGNFGQANYAAAKAGVIGFSKSFAKEVASKGITVNVIAPGFMETDMLANVPDDMKKRILNQIPLERFGKPEEVAELVVFLVSDTGNYIHGQVFAINGGLYI